MQHSDVKEVKGGKASGCNVDLKLPTFTDSKPKKRKNLKYESHHFQAISTVNQNGNLKLQIEQHSSDIKQQQIMSVLSTQYQGPKAVAQVVVHVEIQKKGDMWSHNSCAGNRKLLY